ncbi:MAG: cyclic nucleotide-binding domain-containing protein [Methylococcales bacterium]|nr:cyclic nucleotide-binding domain-containing protein [Methylococcales bacterium]
MKKKSTWKLKRLKKADSVDCIATLLMIPLIRSLPPANLRTISEELEEVIIEKDEVIIEQGGLGSYYYLIKKGECLVTHKNSKHAQAIKVAKLQIWDSFGESALISGEPRAETVTALSKMILLRFHKDKFLKLVKEPSLTFIDFIEWELWQDKGALLLDVRPPDEYEKLHLPDALNAPLFTLRMELKSLDKNQLYIIICEDGKTSESAAFLMKTYGFQVKIIKNGLNYVSKEVVLKAQKALKKTGQTRTIIADQTRTVTADSIADSKKMNAVLARENHKLKLALIELRGKYSELEKEQKVLKEKNKLLFKKATDYQLKWEQVQNRAAKP